MPSTSDWGAIPPEVARLVIQQAALIVPHGVPAPRVEAEFPPPSEIVELRVSTANGDSQVRIPVSELSRHPELAALRASVVSLRKRASGGFFSWRSIGGRLTLLLVCVIGMMTWWIVRDWRETAKMEQAAERIEATVLTRVGKNGYDPTKSITVRFMPSSGQVQEQKIEQYLSAENWDRANPDSTVQVWHDAATGNTYLEDDIQRWNRDKKWIPLLPIGIAIPVLIVSLFLSQYRVGVHDDGREYLVVEDYVAGDDRNAVVDRTKYNAARLLWWLAKGR